MRLEETAVDEGRLLDETTATDRTLDNTLPLDRQHGGCRAAGGQQHAGEQYGTAQRA
jgi:hypothetical protein